ncbi:thioredoxin domain-containing protein [Streptomyces goshikiensis]|uniref:thioredoxin domain-containing protein n=1 Tax=Streptomyces goshikiensis TaxID=1942 RepID=UPI0036C1320C
MRRSRGFCAPRPRSTARRDSGACPGRGREPPEVCPNGDGKRARLEGIAQQHPEPLAAKLNVDENPATATKYGIRSLPTMVVFQKGKVAKTITGAKSTTALEKGLVKFLTKAR